MGSEHFCNFLQTVIGLDLPIMLTSFIKLYPSLFMCTTRCNTMNAFEILSKSVGFYPQVFHHSFDWVLSEQLQTSVRMTCELKAHAPTISLMHRLKTGGGHLSQPREEKYFLWWLQSCSVFYVVFWLVGQRFILESPWFCSELGGCVKLRLHC